MSIGRHCLRLAELPPPPAGMTGWPWTVESEPLPEKRDDGADWPRISIVTPSYNQSQFIEKTIRSVLLQGYPRLEYAVLDGGSTDGSVEIIRKYERWLSFWVSDRDRGQSDAINRGFSQATGDIFSWVNSDDYYAAGAFEKVADAFASADGTVGAVVGIGHKLDSQGRVRFSPLPSSITRDSLIRWCQGENFMQPACFFTRVAWDSSGPLRLDLDFCMDLALWLKMSEHYSFKVINESLAFIHMHQDAKTIAARPRMLGEVSLLLAGQPDGWASGKDLLFWLLDSMGSK